MPASSIDFIETADFKRKADEYLSEVQLAALRSLLAFNPILGQESPDDPGLFMLGWSSSLTVVYVIQVDVDRILIFLVNIVATPSTSIDEPTAAVEKDRKLVRKTLGLLRRFGIGLALKEIAKKVYELIKEHVP